MRVIAVFLTIILVSTACHFGPDVSPEPKEDKYPQRADITEGQAQWDELVAKFEKGERHDIPSGARAILSSYLTIESKPKTVNKKGSKINSDLESVSASKSISIDQVTSDVDDDSDIFQDDFAGRAADLDRMVASLRNNPEVEAHEILELERANKQRVDQERLGSSPVSTPEKSPSQTSAKEGSSDSEVSLGQLTFDRKVPELSEEHDSADSEIISLSGNELYGQSKDGNKHLRDSKVGPAAVRAIAPDERFSTSGELATARGRLKNEEVRAEVFGGFGSFVLVIAILVALIILTSVIATRD
ncbi:hypothetical protein BVY02_00100 [bacterium J17]|nr:hypothetical protein BVY02_00100 [bacterium J17]